MVKSSKLIEPQEYASISTSVLLSEIEYLEVLYCIYEMAFVGPLRAYAEASKPGESNDYLKKKPRKFRVGLLAFLETRRRLKLANAELLKRIDTADSVGP